MRCSGRAAQLMAINGFFANSEESCTALANSSLPTPDSPKINKGIDFPAIFLAFVSAVNHFASPVLSKASASLTGAA